MRIFFVFIIIWLTTTAFSFIFDKDFASCVPLTVTSQIGILYFFGLFGFLYAGLIFVVVLPFALSVYAIIRKRHNIKINRNLVNGSIIFLVIFLYFWYINNGRLIRYWDEFTHWGLIAKNMFYLDNFGNTGLSSARFLDYPPAQGLFQYMFLKICGVFTENRLYHAANILLIAFVFPVTRKCKNPITALLTITVFCCLASNISADVFSSIYVDLLIGVAWANAVSSFFTYEKDSFRTICLTFNMIFLALLKASAFAIGLVCIICFMVYELFEEKKWSNRIENLKKLIVPFAALIVSKVSWNLYLSINNLNKVFTFESANKSSLADLFTGSAPEYRYQTLEAFGKAFFETELFKMGISFTPVLLLIIPVIVFVIIGIISKRKTEVKWLAIIYIAIFAAYVGGLGFSYLFSFDAGEAVILASYTRYMTTVAIGVVTLIVVIAAEYIFTEFKTDDNKKYIKYALTAVLMFVCIEVSVFTDPVVNHKSNIEADSYPRGKYHNVVRIMQENCTPEDRIYYMYPTGYVMDHWMVRFIATPLRIGPLEPFDYRYRDIDQLTDFIFTENDYVFIHGGNDEFRQEYGFMISPEDKNTDGLYKVDKENRLLCLVQEL